MQQLNEELAYLHQAFAFSQDMKDRLAASLVCHASAHVMTDTRWTYTSCRLSVSLHIDRRRANLATAAMHVLRCDALLLPATDAAFLQSKSQCNCANSMSPLSHWIQKVKPIHRHYWQCNLT